MKCPIDDTALVMTDRSGIEIDYCPQCRGVWLDRGELDKIIERSLTPAAQQPMPQQQMPPQSPLAGLFGSRGHGGGHGSGHGYTDQYGRRRKDSFLGQLFD